MSEAAKTPEQVVRKWLLQIQLADKLRESWKKSAKSILERYRLKNRKRNSFNILYSNTETMAAAVYTSPPKPDVRRRYKDDDPVAKIASTIIVRSLEFSIDTDLFASSIKLDVYDMLLPGRGLSRVRYIPTIVPYAAATEVAGEDESGEMPSDQGPDEELAWEQVIIEHVDWDNFLVLGDPNRWDRVENICFIHRLDRAELVKQFGDEIGKAVTLDDVEDENVSKQEDLAEEFKTAVVYEIWSKCDKKVYFIARSYKASPLKVVDDPLELNDFFPVPRPLAALTNPDSMEILPLYEQYREQAQELDLVCARINKIINACKVRGVYDSTMTELSELMKGDDNDLIPTQNAAAWIEQGGIEKGLWMMPIESSAKVLQILNLQRDASKQIIFEIIGLADIMRGTSDPNETYGAQMLKSKFGGQRISLMQIEVQRYARDLIRLMAEVISAKFQPETLMKMANMPLPTDQQIQQMAAQYQQQSMMAQQAQQPPPPQPDKPDASIDQVMRLLRDDCLRSFRIDVETDSMIAATQMQDTQEIQSLLAGIGGFIQQVGPAVQAGAMPVDAVKELTMAIIRRSRLGPAVEDAFEKMKAPTPPPAPPDPNAGEQAKMQMQLQLGQQKMQSDAQITQVKAQADAQVEQARMQADLQIEQGRAQASIEVEKQKQIMQMQSSSMEREHAASLQSITHGHNAHIENMKFQFEQWKAQLEASTRITVAEISAKTTMSSALISAETAANNQATKDLS
mgnify:CR=1 FL=1